MPKTASKKFSAKTLKGLFHLFVFHVAFPYALEYLVCLGGTWVVNSTLFHGKLSTFTAALGVWAIGLLTRYFMRTRQQQPHLKMNPADFMNPADLAAFAAELEKELAKQQNPSAPSPYL